MNAESSLNTDLIDNYHAKCNFTWAGCFVLVLSIVVWDAGLNPDESIAEQLRHLLEKLTL